MKSINKWSAFITEFATGYSQGSALQHVVLSMFISGPKMRASTVVTTSVCGTES